MTTRSCNRLQWGGKYCTKDPATCKYHPSRRDPDPGRGGPPPSDTPYDKRPYTGRGGAQPFGTPHPSPNADPPPWAEVLNDKICALLEQGETPIDLIKAMMLGLKAEGFSRDFLLDHTDRLTSSINNALREEIKADVEKMLIY